jgi:hypothetical protein
VNGALLPTETLLAPRCVECGRPQQQDELWHLSLVDIGELAIYCPECSRERVRLRLSRDRASLLPRQRRRGSGAAVWTRLRHPPPKTSTTRAKTRRAVASAQHRRTRPRLFPRREARARVSRFRRGSRDAQTLLWLMAPLPRKRADAGGRGSTTCPPVAARRRAA